MIYSSFILAICSRRKRVYQGIIHKWLLLQILVETLKKILWGFVGMMPTVKHIACCSEKKGTALRFFKHLCGFSQQVTPICDVFNVQNGLILIVCDWKGVWGIQGWNEGAFWASPEGRSRRCKNDFKNFTSFQQKIEFFEIRLKLTELEIR